MDFVEQSRRRFLGVAAAAAGTVCAAPPAQGHIRLGLVIGFAADPEAAIDRVAGLGFASCMVFPRELTSGIATRLRDALQRRNVDATALVTLGPGEMVWDFLRGPATIGLVPRKYRQARLEHMKRASDFARMAGISAVQTHCGFIPEDPSDPLYEETVQAIRSIGAHCRGNDQLFLCETGQETPVTLLRTITDVGLDNVHVGLDTANLILYGKGNPSDALEVLGTRVRSVMAKDGLFPTDPRRLGREVAIGEGRVNFAKLIPNLIALGYRGSLTIEREISGPQQLADIRKGKKYLERIIRNAGA